MSTQPSYYITFEDNHQHTTGSIHKRLNCPLRQSHGWKSWQARVANQTESRRILDKFETLYLTDADQYWAMQQLERFQFSHHIGMNDCLIASVAHRLQIPLYTHNLRDMTPMIGEVAVKLYAYTHKGSILPSISPRLS